MLWHGLTAPEVEARARQGYVAIPFGTTQQHGRHLLADTYTHQAARRVVDLERA